MSKERKREAFRHAANNSMLDLEVARACYDLDRDLAFPEDWWEDPLRLLGNLEPLKLTRQERKIVRRATRDIIARRGARYVWENKCFLKAEIPHFLSLC